MKKIIALTLCGILLLSGCSSSSVETEETATSSEEITEAEPEIESQIEFEAETETIPETTKNNANDTSARTSSNSSLGRRSYELEDWGSLIISCDLKEDGSIEWSFSAFADDCC